MSHGVVGGSRWELHIDGRGRFLEDKAVAALDSAHSRTASRGGAGGRGRKGTTGMSVDYEDRRAVIDALREVSRVLAKGPYGPSVLCQHGAGEVWYCGHPWSEHLIDGNGYEYCCWACLHRGGGTEEHCFLPVAIDVMGLINW